MARWSPTRSVQTTVPTIYDALNELYDRGSAAASGLEQRREGERQRVIEDEERGRRRESEDLASAMNEITFHRSGGRRFSEAPTRDMAPGEDVLAGASAPEGGPGIGMQRGRTEATPPVFQGMQPGMGQRGAPEPPLIDGLDELMQRGRPQQPKMVAPAGSFIPGVGFAAQNITDNMLPGQPPQQPRQRQDERYVGLGGDRYLDTDTLREAQESEDPFALAAALMGMGATQEEAMLVLTDPSKANEVLRRLQSRDQQFTREELVAAGIPANMLEAALRDPGLARQLMTASQREASGGGAGGSGGAAAADRRGREARDAFISRLIADGERDPGRLLEAAGERFPDTPTALRDVRAQLASDDPMIQQRRDAIQRAAHPVTYGGGQVLWQIVEDLAQGRSRREVERDLAEAYEGEEGHQEYQNALNYLSILSGAEGLANLLNLGGN